MIHTKNLSYVPLGTVVNTKKMSPVILVKAGVTSINISRASEMAGQSRTWQTAGARSCREGTGPAYLLPTVACENVGQVLWELLSFLPEKLKIWSFI